MDQHSKLNGELIKDYMRREGRKQTWVAAYLGISQSSLVKMMKGHVPRPETLQRLSELLGVDTSDLVEQNVA